MKPFDPTKPVTTRDGRSVELKSTSMRGIFPIIGYIGDQSKQTRWMADGHYSAEKLNQTPHDLINPPEKVWRPWTPEEAAKHVGEKVKSKSGDTLCSIITRVDAYGDIYTFGARYEAALFLKKMVFMDGTPCGVETEAA